MCEQWISDILQGLPTAMIALLVGVVAAGVAQRHAAMVEARLKLDLFEKRHEVFLATWRFLSDLLQKNPVTTADIFAFSTDTANAQFLFGAEVVKFLEETQSNGIRLGTAEYTLARSPSPEVRSAMTAERHQLVTWAEHELKHVKDRFKPYLDMSKCSIQPRNRS